MLARTRNVRAVASQVGAEGVRILAWPRAEVVACLLDDQVDGQIDAAIEIPCQANDVLLGVGRIKIGLEHRRRFLEEKVVVVPGHKLVDLDIAISGQHRVDLRLGLGERLTREIVEPIE